MATYLELHTTAADNEQNWAAAVIDAPKQHSASAIYAVLAANKGLSVASILSASDAAIQSNIDSLVDALVVAHNI